MTNPIDLYPDTPARFARVVESRRSAIQQRLAATGDRKEYLRESRELEAWIAPMLSTRPIDRSGGPRLVLNPNLVALLEAHCRSLAQLCDESEALYRAEMRAQGYVGNFPPPIHKEYSSVAELRRDEIAGPDGVPGYKKARNGNGECAS